MVTHVFFPKAPHILIKIWERKGRTHLFFLHQFPTNFVSYLTAGIYRMTVRQRLLTYSWRSEVP